jgi:16S rRNA processing protein RimM
MGQARILVGQIGQAHGLKGEVKLASFMEEPSDIARCGGLEAEDGRMQLKIESLKPRKGGLIARFAGIDDRTKAEGLKGVKLYIGRDRLPPLEKNRYYHADLIGLEARAQGGEVLGRVSSVVNFGAGDILELKGALSAETLLVPFAGAKVDVAEGVIDLDLPEGFLDEVE